MDSFFDEEGTYEKIPVKTFDVSNAGLFPVSATPVAFAVAARSETQRADGVERDVADAESLHAGSQPSGHFMSPYNRVRG